MQSEEPSAGSPIAAPELSGDLSQAVALSLQIQNSFAAYCTLRAAQLLAIRFCIANPGVYPFPNQITLKLGDCGYDSRKRRPLLARKPLSSSSEKLSLVVPRRFSPFAGSTHATNGCPIQRSRVLEC